MDLTVDDFPAGSFDLIHTRWVLSNLREPEALLRRITPWLAEGGWLLARAGADGLSTNRCGCSKERSAVAGRAAGERSGVFGSSAPADHRMGVKLVEQVLVSPCAVALTETTTLYPMVARPIRNGIESLPVLAVLPVCVVLVVL